MKIRKKQWICGGAAVLSLAVFGVLTAVSSHIAGLHEAQYAAKRWQGDSDLRYTQMSAFYPADAGVTEDSLQYIRESVDAAVRSASLTAPNANARVWCDAYSAPAGSVQAAGTKRYPVQAEVTAVGGDFFALHAPVLRSGCFLQENDLMQDRLVLDETLAWQLFGSSDVAGMEVQIGSRMYPVAGVVAQETDYASEKAYGEFLRMYISFDLYEEWTAERGGMANITCYEMVLPDPVRNFARNTFEQSVGMGGNMKIMQNTDRFSISNRWKQLRSLHDMMVVSDSLAYPFWENAARIVDFDLALLLAGQILFLLYPLLTVFRILWRIYRTVDNFVVKKRQAHKNRFRSLIKTD